MTSETNRKSSKNKANQRIMDEAPLFAGLDDFVIQHLEKPSPQTPLTPKKVKAPREQKKKTPPSKKPVRAEAAITPTPKLTRSPKLPQMAACDSDAMLLSIRDICILLKISRATLVRMDNAGKIPGRMKLGGSVRFHRATVVAWLESMITPAAPPDIPF